ncbi:hypothetical protein [Bosea sp. CRIB-10]|uniref:hypothetical protein n=1 Tax=Bosea sp. CRIB-10 TaxID=378404 RepID=UPI0011134B50|nr:hypothetical protein [Bosea sp. CRIB-10]
MTDSNWPGAGESRQPSQSPAADLDAACQARVEAFGESGNASKNPEHGGSRHMRLTAMGGASTMM